MTHVVIPQDAYLDCYQHLLEENDIDIELIWGGRDSGKSKFVAQYLTEQAMGLDYFRCLLIKQTHESIKDAQWQMIQDTATQWGVDELFKFKTSPLAITCTENGNTFATRGMDKPAKLRSFSNPSHAWIEEGNQISEEAFITILTSLRSDYSKVKLYVTFNPESDTPDFADFWIYKIFFKQYEPLQSFIGKWEIPVVVNGQKQLIEFKYRCTHTTYHDNRYVSVQRRAFHESLATFNPYFYRVYTLGLWGNKENDSPWAFAFNEVKHVPKDPALFPVATRYQTLYISFDFNRNPMCCTLFQWYDGMIRGIETVKIPKSGTDAMCNYILLHYPGYLYIVTGDYNGDKASSLYEEQVTNYMLIQQKLRLTDAMLVIVPNPRQAKNQTLVNNILHYYPCVFHPVKCKELIFDFKNVKKRADGTIVKDDRDDPAQQSDALDTFRYFCNTFMPNFLPPVGLFS